MANLFTTLGSVSRALDAQRYGLDVAGQNIANVNTPGFTRRTIDLRAVAPEAPGTAGRGVDVVGIRAMRDRLLETRLRNELPAQTREAAVAEALSIVEASIGQPGKSIDANMQKFFDSFATLAESPFSTTARENVLVQGEELASGFRNMAGRLESARRDADRQVRGNVDDINALIGRIAALNENPGGGASGEGALHVSDEQGRLVRELAALIDVRVLERSGGGIDVSIGNGHAVVVGATSYELVVTGSAPAGYATLSVGDADVTGEITGGRLGGFLQVRDVNIPDYMARLDDVAYSVATEVNALHAAGFDQTGAAGGAFFSFSSALAGTAGAAAALVVRPALAADSRLVAASNTTEAGDNGTAKAIASLRQTGVLNGDTTTLAEAWGQLVYRVARDTSVAVSERDSRNEIVRQVDALRDEVSGVSLDEEAMHLMKFQRAYEANARFFQVIDRTLDLLLGLSGR